MWARMPFLRSFKNISSTPGLLNSNPSIVSGILSRHPQFIIISQRKWISKKNSSINSPTEDSVSFSIWMTIGISTDGVSTSNLKATKSSWVATDWMNRSGDWGSLGLDWMGTLKKWYSGTIAGGTFSQKADGSSNVSSQPNIWSKNMLRYKVHAGSEKLCQERERWKAKIESTWSSMLQISFISNMLGTAWCVSVQ